MKKANTYLFKKQILESKEITVTDSNMTRFMMTLSEAVDLTLEACVRAQGGRNFRVKDACYMS